MQEIWKDIKDYEGLYQVSNLGRIKRLRFINRHLNFKKEKILKPYKDGGNYYFVIGLHKNGKRKYKAIHRLVAETFIPNPNNYPLVNHKDENKTNNNVDNLEWCTHKYNSNYGNANNKMREKALQNWEIRRLSKKY